MSESRCQFLVALDQCGLELQGPHMLTTAKRLIPSREVDAGALDRDSLRYHTWDPQTVRAHYSGLDAANSYEIEATFACARSESRTVALVVGDLEVVPAIAMVPGGATVVRVAVPEAALRDGAIDVAVVRKSGPDATLSELRLFGSSAPAPLLTVVGDSRGGLIGTVSDAAYNGIPDVAVGVAWRGGERKSTTDAQGVFRIALRDCLPHGQHRELRITAAVAGRTATQSIDTRALAQGLREVPPEDARLDLAGEWRFVPGRWPDPAASEWADAKTTHVPGHVAFDGLIPEAGVATLQKTLTLPAEWSGDAVFARFDGVYGRSELFVNGVHAATHSAGATSFDVDLTTLLTAGDNQLTVVITEYTPHSVLDYMSWYAHTSLLGIWREAYLFHVPKLHLGPMDLRADWAVEDGSGRADIATEIINLNAETQPYELTLSLRDGDRLVHQTMLNGEVRGRDSMHRAVTLSIPDIAPWSAEVPRLYDLDLLLEGAKGEIATYRRRVGFRRIEVRDRQLLINGAPIRITGINRHDARMRTGRSMRTEDLRHDVLALRQANVNVIRTSHYPADPRLLALCDELGMYVNDQMPICFAAGFDDHHWTRFNDAAQLVPYVLEVTAETVARDHAHPSVIMWDLANETQWGWGFDVQQAMVRRMDPSRPTIFSFDLNQLGDTNPLPKMPAKARPDFRTYHYPGWDRSWQEDIDWLRTYDQPAVLTECNPPFQDNARAPLHAELLAIDPGLRDHWVTAAKPFMARVLADRGCIGGMIWTAVDDEWVLPLDESVGSGNWAHLTKLDYYRVRDVHPPQDGLVFRGEGEWGPLDSWGRERPELWHIHKLYSPIEVVRAAFDPSGTRLELAIWNRHAHRALETLEVRLAGATVGGATSSRAVAAAGATATLVLDVPADASRVEVTFVHPEGWIVDAFSWAVPGRGADVASAVRAAATPARVVADSVSPIAADGSGRWLTAWPRLHVQDINSPQRPMMLPAADTSRASVGADGTIGVPLTDGDWIGSLTVRADGAATIFEYDCTYDGAEAFDAHEVGLAFHLPAELGDLWWDRDSDWSHYPEGHIGRPRGYASSAPGPANPLRPASRWEADTTEAGMNDYRSSKRSVRAAGATDGTRSVTILSDGSQHVRASIRDGAPVLHVLDWYGGVPFRNDTDHIWTATFGTGKRIARGIRLQGQTRMIWGSLPAEIASWDRGTQPGGGRPQ